MKFTQLRWVCCVLISGSLAIGAAQAQTETQNDLMSLKASLKQVLDSHSRVLAARQDISAANFRALGLSRPIYNPEVGAEAESGDLDSYALVLSQSLSTGGKQTARKILGESGQSLAWAEFEQLRHEIVIDILRAMVDYKAAEALMQVAARRSELMNTFYETASKRYVYGDLGQSEVNLARVALASALDNMAAAQREIASAKSVLLIASQNEKGADWPEIRSTPMMLEGLTDLELQLVPSIRLAILGAQVATASAELANANTKPDPNFTLRAGKEGSDSLLGLSFSIPIFVRNNFSEEYKAALDEELAAFSRARAQMTETRVWLQVIQQSYEAAQQGWQAWQSLMTGQTEPALELNETLWKSGEITTSEYLIQLDQLLESSAAGINLRFRVQSIWVDWLDASAAWRNWFTRGELS